MSTDVLTRLKEARAQSQSGDSSSPFFFVKTDEKALVRILRNHDQMVVIRGHRKFDEITRRYMHNVCAKEFDLPCQLCLDAAGDWKLKAQDFFYQVVYCHKKVDADGQAREVAQLLYLEMPAYDGVLAGLDALYWAEDEGSRDITQCDYVISKIGTGNKSKYSVVARKNAPMALPADLMLPTDEKIRSDVELARPSKPVDDGVALGDLQINKADTSFMPDEFGGDDDF